jgi:pantetheine-phosphate adenylyltransferase
VEVASFSGLLVDFAESRGIGTIVKGLRAVSDFDYELQMAQMNRELTAVDTIFMPTAPQWSYVSSTLIREIASLGGDITAFLPPQIAEQIRSRVAEREGRKPP